MVDYNNYLVWQQLLHALPTGDLLHFPFVLESVNRCPPIRAPPPPFWMWEFLLVITPTFYTCNGLGCQQWKYCMVFITIFSLVFIVFKKFLSKMSENDINCSWPLPWPSGCSSSWYSHVLCDILCYTVTCNFHRNVLISVMIFHFIHEILISVSSVVSISLSLFFLFSDM